MEQEHASGIATKLVIDRTLFRYTRPASSKPLPVLNGFSFQQKDELGALAIYQLGGRLLTSRNGV